MSELNEKPEEQDPYKRKKNKKRRNFLANAKKYAKKGQMGRGTKMPEETYQYFLGILTAMKEGIHDEDERVALVNNVLERTKGQEANIVGNQLGCRVIEILLPYASAEDLERFIEVLMPDVRRLVADNFTSHVMETLLRVCAERATEHLQSGFNNMSDTDATPKKKRKKEDPHSKYTEEHIKNCHNYTIKMSKYILNNMEDFVFDPYANHILRCALKSLSGITLLPGEKPKVNYFRESSEPAKGIPPHITKLEYKTVPDDFKDIVKEFATRLSMWPQFKDMPYDNLTSGMLQVLLHAVKNVDKNLTKEILKKLLNESFAPDDWNSNCNDDKKECKVDVEEENREENGKDREVVKEGNITEESNSQPLPPVFESEPAVRLLEAALFVAKKKMYTQIYAKCFINRLGELATKPMLNFTVQRLIDNCHIKEEFEPIFDELSPRLCTLLAGGNTGVVAALAKACLRIRARQTHFVNSLEAALECSEKADQKYFSVCCLRLTPRSRIDVTALEKDYFIHIHGSVVLQTILGFQRPAKAVQSLLELTPDGLMVILNDAKGCHVADAFCKSECVGVKARDKLIWLLKGYYQSLALSQYGSRAFEQIFEAASFEQKVKIMLELSDKSNLLNSTQYGRLIASKLDVSTFKLSQKNWENSWKRKEVKQENK